MSEDGGESDSSSNVHASDLCDDSSPVEVLSFITRALVACQDALAEPSSRCSKSHQLRVARLLHEVAGAAGQMSLKWTECRTRSDVNCDIVTALQKDLSPKFEKLNEFVHKGTFADVVARPAANIFPPLSGLNKAIPKPSSAVIVFPTSEGVKTSAETSKLVRSALKPSEIGVHVSGMRNGRDRGIVVYTNSENEANALIRSTNEANSGLRAEQIKKEQPKVVVFDVPINISEDDFFKSLYHQNLCDMVDSFASYEDMRKLCTLSHRMGPKVNACHWVISVPPQVRHKLRNQGRVYIEWERLNIRDFLGVTRCHKCQLYGHPEKYCKSNVANCEHCGTSGHRRDGCPALNTPPKCATCTVFKKDNSHVTGDLNCSARKRATDMISSRTDYGS